MYGSVVVLVVVVFVASRARYTFYTRYPVVSVFVTVRERVAAAGEDKGRQRRRTNFDGSAQYRKNKIIITKIKIKKKPEKNRRRYY